MNSYDERKYKELIENIVYMFEIVSPEDQLDVWQSIAEKITPIVIKSLQRSLNQVPRYYTYNKDEWNNEPVDVGYPLHGNE